MWPHWHVRAICRCLRANLGAPCGQIFPLSGEAVYTVLSKNENNKYFQSFILYAVCLSKAVC